METSRFTHNVLRLSQSRQYPRVQPSGKKQPAESPETKAAEVSARIVAVLAEDIRRVLGTKEEGA